MTRRLVIKLTAREKTDSKAGLDAVRTALLQQGIVLQVNEKPVKEMADEQLETDIRRQVQDALAKQNEAIVTQITEAAQKGSIKATVECTTKPDGSQKQTVRFEVAVERETLRRQLSAWVALGGKITSVLVKAVKAFAGGE